MKIKELQNIKKEELVNIIKELDDHIKKLKVQIIGLNRLLGEII